MNESMPARYCEASGGTNTGGSSAPTAAAPLTAPTYVYSLKFLSLTVPTSVTTAIRRSIAPGDPGAPVAGASVAGASVAGASVAGASVAGASVAGASVAGRGVV